MVVSDAVDDLLEAEADLKICDVDDDDEMEEVAFARRAALERMVAGVVRARGRVCCSKWICSEADLKIIHPLHAVKVAP